MKNRQRVSALSGLDLDQDPENWSRQGIAIREMPAQSRFALSVCDTPGQAILNALSTALGSQFQGCPGLSSTGAVTVLCLAPKKWLLLAAPDVGVAGKLEPVLSTLVSHLADVSSAMVGFEVSGRDATSLMASVCPVDLDPLVFRPGCCTRSLLARVPVCLFRPQIKPDRGDCLQLFVDRSFANYAWDWLTDAAG